MSLKKTRRERKFKQIAPVIVTVILVFGLSYIVLFSNFVKIKAISLDPPDSQIESYLKTQIFESSNPLNDNYLFLAKAKIKSQVTKTFPQIKDLTFNYNFNTKTLVISFSTRLPAFISCQNTCELIDNEGIVLKKGVTLSGYNLPELIFETSTQILANLNPDVLKTIETISQKITQINYASSVAKTEIRANNDLFFYFKNDPALYFDPTKDLDEQFYKLQVFLSKLQPGVNLLKSFSYFDLRIPQKFFACVAGENCSKENQ